MLTSKSTGKSLFQVWSLLTHPLYANPMSKDNNDDLEADLEPSELDEFTHAEMLSLYRESTRTILFAKTRQWRTLGAAFIAQVAIVTVGHLIDLQPYMHRTLIILSFMISAMSISIIVIYQIWQHTEMLKLRKISGYLSGHFGMIRGIKSRVEANIHRYILLFVMVASIAIANIIAYIAYLPILPLDK